MAVSGRVIWRLLIRTRTSRPARASSDTARELNAPGGYAGHNRAANAERGRQHGCGLGCEGKARLGEGVLERLSGAAAGLAEHQPSARQFTDGHPAGLRPSVTVLHNDFDGVVSDGDRPEAGGNDRGLDEPEVCGSLAYGLDDRAAVGGCELNDRAVIAVRDAPPGDPIR